MQILCYFTITVVAKPNNSGEVHLDVSIEDNQGGSGIISVLFQVAHKQLNMKELFIITIHHYI